MKKTIASAVFLLGPGLLWSQNMTPKVVQADVMQKRWSVGGSPNSQIATLPMSPGTKVAEVYLDPSWKRSSVAIYGSDQLLDGYPARYDLKANSLEFNINNEFKILDVRRVKSMVWLDSLTNIPHNFVNGKEYQVNNTPMTALLEVLVEGKLPLYKEYQFWIKKPDFNPALNVGSPDELIYKKDVFYFGTGKALQAVPDKKKSIPAIFGDQAEAMKGYIKQQGLSVGKEGDLVKLFEYYNSLP